MFETVEMNDKTYRKNINTTGDCKYYKGIPCVCCNPNCDHNVSIDDLLEEQLEEDMWNNMIK
jgi:hypothetical protein